MDPTSPPEANAVLARLGVPGDWTEADTFAKLLAPLYQTIVRHAERITDR